MLGIMADGAGSRVQRLALLAHSRSRVTGGAIVLENGLAVCRGNFPVLIAVGQAAWFRFRNVHPDSQRFAARGAVDIDQFSDLPSLAPQVHGDVNLAVGSGREYPGL